jgi:hypothetical protein
MKKILLGIALALFAMLPDAVRAQVVVQVPSFIAPNTLFDFGNGPLEMRVVQGNALFATASSTGVGSTSGSATLLTLTAIPATAPCNGCIISGTGITSGTTVSSSNGSLLTLSAAMTVAASTAVAWGAACPTTPAGPQTPFQAGVSGDTPFYTQARICGYGAAGPGASVVAFPIGAH